MPDNFGTDLRALDDLPLTDDLVSGEEGIAYEQARRLLSSAGGLVDCGDEAEYESVDLRERMGGRLSESDRVSLEQEVRAVLLENPAVTATAVSVTVSAGTIGVEYEADAADLDAPIRGVLSIDSVDGASLEVQ